MKEAVHRKCQKKSGFYKSKEKKPNKQKREVTGLSQERPEAVGKIHTVYISFFSLSQYGCVTMDSKTA